MGVACPGGVGPGGCDHHATACVVLSARFGGVDASPQHADAFASRGALVGSGVKAGGLSLISAKGKLVFEPGCVNPTHDMKLS